MDETHIADHSPFTLTYAETLMTKIRSLATADVMGVMFDKAKGNTPHTDMILKLREVSSS